MRKPQPQVKFGTSGGTQRFRCKACRKTFTALTGTPFSRLRGKEKLLENAACMVDGLSIRKTATKLGFSVNKTFRWRHKFLAFLNEQKPAGMPGVVETDETFFPLSFKGQRKGLPRPAKKRGVATKYLANYLGWRRLLDRFQDALPAQQFLFHALRSSYSNPPINS